MSEFHITIDLHQGPTLSPYLFAIVMDELTRSIQNEVPQCVLFGNYIVLGYQTRLQLNAKLEIWMDA